MVVQFLSAKERKNCLSLRDLVSSLYSHAYFAKEISVTVLTLLCFVCGSCICFFVVVSIVYQFSLYVRVLCCEILFAAYVT